MCNFGGDPAIQGRLSLSTDGDKCAMVNFGGNEKSIGGNEIE